MNKIKYIGASWCPQCSAIKPQFDSFCKSCKLEYDYVDAEENEALINQYNIRNLPTILMIDENNNITFRGTGFDGFKEFKQIFITTNAGY